MTTDGSPADRAADRLTPTPETERPTNVPGFADVDTEALNSLGFDPGGVESAFDDFFAGTAPTAFDSQQPQRREDAPQSFISRIFNAPGIGTVTRGLEALQRNVVDPTFGTFWGWASQLPAVGFPGFDRVNERGRERRRKVSQEFRDRVLSREGSYWSNAGEFLRQTDTLSDTEKFIGSIAFDPTSYVGYGLLSKVPLVGTTGLRVTGSVAGRSKQVEISLGALERGFIAATELPFRQGSRLVRATIPKSRTQTIRHYAGAAEQAVGRFYSEIQQGGRSTAVTRAKLVKELTVVTDPKVAYHSLPSDAHRHMVDLLYETAPMNRAQLDDLRKVAKTKEPIHPHQAHAISNMVQLAVQRKTPLQHVGARIVRTLGGSLDDEQAVRRVGDWLTKQVDTVQRNVDQIVTGTNPETFRAALSAKAGQLAKTRYDLGFEQWTENLGYFGGIARGLDRFNTNVIQAKIQRWAARPLASQVLMTPGFVVDEITESITRQVLGRSSWGFRNRLQFASDFAGFEDEINPQLLKEEAEGVSRASLVKDDVLNDRSVGLPQIAAGLGVKVPSGVVSKLNLFGRTWFDKANVVASATRRKFLSSRASKRLYDLYDTQHPWAAKAVDRFPASLRSLESDLAPTVAIRMAQGKPEAVLALKEEFTAEAFREKELWGLRDHLVHDLADGTVLREYDNWIESGADALALEGTFESMAERGFDNMLISAENAAAQTEVVLAALRRMDPSDVAQKRQAVRMAQLIFDDINDVPSRLNQATTVKIRRGEYGKAAKFNAGRKQAIHDRTTQQIDRFFEQHDSLIRDVADQARRFGNADLANAYTDHYQLVRDRWRDERKAIAELFNSTDDRSSVFWNRFDEIKKSYWEDPHYAELLADARSRIRRAEMASTGAEKPNVRPSVIGEDHRLTPEDVARAVGSNSEEVLHAIAAASLGSKANFTSAVLDLAQEFQVTIAGDARKRLNEFYDASLAAMVKTRASEHSAFTSFEESLKGFQQEVRAAAMAPKVQPEQVGDLHRYLDEVADAVRTNSSAKFRLDSRQAVRDSVEDLKQAFVNYDDTNMLDGMMATLFPFWTYESRRIPFLLRTGLQHPKLWEQFGPEGRFYEQTDNGYFRPGFLGGFEFNPFRGTFMGTSRRIFQEPFRESGVFNRIDAEVLQRTGFYFGPLQRVGIDAVNAMFSDDRFEAGELLTPAMEMPLMMLETIPGIGSRVAKFRGELLPDKFVERQMLRELWEMGLPAHEVDIEKLAPKPGSSITEAQIREAWRRASYRGLVEVITGKTRFRGSNENQYRDAVEQFYLEKGLSLQEVREAQRDGIPLSSLVVLSPAEQRFLQELPGFEEKSAGDQALRSGERREITLKISDFWDEIDALSETNRGKKEEINTKWFNGEYDRKAYLSDLSDLNRQTAEQVQLARGRTLDEATGEWVKTNPAAEYAGVPLTPEELLEYRNKYGYDGIEPLRHELEEVLQEYREIRPRDANGDGVVEWNDYFDAVAAFEEQLPDALLTEFHNELDRRLTEPERVLRELQRGIVGAYWDIDDQIAESLGVTAWVNALDEAQRFGDENTEEYLRRRPEIRRYNQERNRIKELARTRSPRLDYALFIYGFTTSFKSDVARSWWQSDGQRPNLARLNQTSDDAVTTRR